MYHRPGHQALTPPPNFAIIEPNVYRSAYPTLASVPYLKHIGLRTIVLLSIEHLPGPVVRLLAAPEREKRSGAAAAAPPVRIACAASLASWMNEYLWTRDDFAVSDVRQALDFALDADFHPVLFACPTGEVQTSVVAACMRRYNGWTVAAALAESDLFADVTREVRESVMRFIERWDPREHPVHEADIAQRKRKLLTRERPHEEEGSAENSTEEAPPVVCIAQWYTAARAHRALLAAEIAAAREKKDTHAAADVPPHERFLGVLNPPAIDERSSFTKESIVEEDDD